jgi:alpha-L-fucosidase
MSSTTPSYDRDPDFAIAPGPFQPTWDSLAGFRCPDWFRDAKLGFWAHWGPQAVPMYGDWYARQMYMEGSDQYRFHCRTYGHPSRFGFKDVAALWKAERFDPDALISLYKGAGARYFVALAVHHDNFDCWASKHHRWNSVKVGPGKDVVGMWRNAARAQGLRFGVTEHLERSYSWLNTSKFSDKEGPYAGVPYDGASADNESLYFPLHGDTSYAYPSSPPEWWKKQWFQRIRDLVDSYEPDLLYTDGAVPFGEVGRRLVAHLYNASAKRHGGKSEAVYTLKHLAEPHHLNHGEYVDGIGLLDIERGVIGAVRDEPWQTDTCIGGWYYDRRAVYKTAAQVVAMLVDIVAKNGNLLLNIPLRPDGTPDDEGRHVVDGIARWMAVNGEAIYGTRPWTVFGEGPTQSGGGDFNESALAWTAEDFRFTRKGNTVFAFGLGWPESRRATVKSLALQQNLRVRDVRLVGHDGTVAWHQVTDGLRVELPARRPCAWVHTLAVELQA